MEPCTCLPPGIIPCLRNLTVPMPGLKPLYLRLTSKKMEKEYPEIYQKVLVDRNNSWISTIESYFESEAVEFVLAGALHMHGKNGILHHLEERGYRISQLE